MKGKRWRRWIFGIIGIVIAAALALTLIGRRSKGEESTQPVYTVEKKRLTKNLYLSGMVLPLRSVVVFSSVQGQIKKVLVKEGDTVVQDQPLLVVDPDHSFRLQVEEADGKVKSARQQVETLEREYARQKSVQNVVAPAALDKLRSDLELARLSLRDATRSHETLQKSLGVNFSGARSLEMEVVAPIAGVVTLLNKTAGDAILLDAKPELLVISDMSKMLVRSEVSEADLTDLAVGQKAEVKLMSLNSKTYAGKVERVSPQGIRNGGSTFFQVDVAIDAPDKDVRPNMTASLTVEVARKDGALALPWSAVASYRGNAVVKPRGKEGYVKVKLGLATDTDVEILPGKLAPGTKVEEIEFSKIDLDALGRGELGS